MSCVQAMRGLVRAKTAHALGETMGEELPVGYVGSYAMLMAFIKDCRNSGCEALSEGRFLELRDAIEDLSQYGEKTGVNLQQGIFKGEQVSKYVLGSLGIAFKKEEDLVVWDASRTRSETSQTVGVEISQQVCLFANPPATSSFNRAGSVGSVTGMSALEDDVLMLCHALSSPNNLIKKYSISVEKLAGWMVAIAKGYLDVPYHNWGHALDVFFFSFFAVTKGEVSKFFNFQDIFALLLAAIAHDVGHAGVNNAFLVATSDILAIRYNDQSPLENMHSSIFFETMRRPGLDFLSRMPAHDFGVLRAKVISAILSTDMSKHFEFVDRMTSRLEKKEAMPFVTDTKNTADPEVRERQKASKSDRRLLLQGFLHLADLGSSCKRWSNHVKCVVALEEEFFYQGDRERELGIPIMPMMDRRKDSAASGQSFFLGKMVFPLLELCAHFIDEEVAESLFENLDNNIKSWEELLKIHGKKTAAEISVLDVGETQRSRETLV